MCPQQIRIFTYCSLNTQYEEGVENSKMMEFDKCKTLWDCEVISLVLQKVYIIAMRWRDQSCISTKGADFSCLFDPGSELVHIFDVVFLLSSETMP